MRSVPFLPGIRAIKTKKIKAKLNLALILVREMSLVKKTLDKSF